MTLLGKLNSSTKMELQLAVQGLLGVSCVLGIPLQSIEDDYQCRKHIVQTIMTQQCCGLTACCSSMAFSINGIFHKCLYQLWHLWSIWCATSADAM